MKSSYSDEDLRRVARWLLENSEYYFGLAMEEAETLLMNGEDPTK